MTTLTILLANAAATTEASQGMSNGQLYTIIGVSLATVVVLLDRYWWSRERKGKSA